MKTFDEVFIDKSRYGTKIKTGEYLDSGKNIIVDQGQSVIAGYTNKTEGLFNEVPAIVFGDHTRVIKYVDKPFFLGADGVKVLRSKQEDANYKYLFYALKSIDIPDTGYNRHFKWLKQSQIKYPTKEKQQEIVVTLDLLNKIINNKKEELEKLDLLIKSRFVEMFGEPKNNSCNWNCKKFGDICESLDSRRKPISSSDRVKGKYPYYGASGVVDYIDDYIFDEDILLISEDGANLLARNTPIAFSVSGKAWVNNHAHVVKFEKMSLQKYVEIYFSLIDISENITGSAQPKLNQSNLNNILIPMPDEELLEKFYITLKQIDKLKVEVQKSLDKTQMLFDSLMQEYFG